MMPLIIRVVKRLLVFVLVALIAYLTVWKVFPFFDNRSPEAVAVLATYAVVAYGLIPAIIRLFRLFFRPSHVPLYSITPDGFASDPVNIGIVGSRREIIIAMEAAGWLLAEKRTITTLSRQIASFIFKQPYPNAPMSPLYLFGRKQDLGFEVEIESSRGHRHHVRFWATDVQTAQEFAHHAKFWHRFYLPKHQQTGRHLWVGAASKDVGLAPIRHNAQLTHMIDPDTNAEREKIVRDLKRAGKVVSTQTVTVNKPYAVKNRVLRGYLHSDGTMTICQLKP